MIDKKKVAILMAIMTLSSTVISCASTDTKPETNAEKIKRFSELALKECGKGNVKAVNINGFSCFK